MSVDDSMDVLLEPGTPPPYSLDAEMVLAPLSQSSRKSRSRSAIPHPLVDAPNDCVLRPPTLNPEQLAVVQSAFDGESLFYTGGAGTGKSLVLREIIRVLREKYAKVTDAVGVTSMTGSAAANIGGTTIHSFFGLGLALEPAKALAAKIRYKSNALRRWRKVKALIVDEVSMLDGGLFDKLARIACIIRKSTEPFGGIQVVLTGDFFQLPPVSKPVSTYYSAPFAFEAKSWDSVISRIFKLTTIYRQKDKEFADMLNEVRFGRLSRATVTRFLSLSRPLPARNGVEPTELFPRRLDVDRANMQRFHQLSTPVHEYICVDGGTVQDPMQREKLLSSVIAPTRLVLRVGAQVMLVKNTDQGLVNGTIGYVVAFNPAPTPAAPAPDVDASAAGPLFPLISFRLANGLSREVLVQPHSFCVEAPSGEVRASRLQLPLILAWAISIHKAQGQTLELVRVDLKKAFEKGQVYVALSRATSLDGLQVLNFQSSMVVRIRELRSGMRPLKA